MNIVKVSSISGSQPINKVEENSSRLAESVNAVFVQNEIPKMEEGIKRKREESLAEGNYDLKNRNITEPPSKKAKQVKSNYFLRSSLSPSVHKSNGSAERLSKVEATSSELAESESTVFVQNEIPKIKEGIKRKCFCCDSYGSSATRSKDSKKQKTGVSSLKEKKKTLGKHFSATSKVSLIKKKNESPGILKYESKEDWQNMRSFEDPYVELKQMNEKRKSAYSCLKDVHILRKANGNVYEGQMKKGQFSGLGTYTYSSSDSMEKKDFTRGPFADQYLTKKGRVYKGNFAHNKFNGEGELTFRNGSVYIGGFKDGLFFGPGIFSYPNGTVYKGWFINNLAHGEGTFEFSNGDIFFGHFQEGVLLGKGELVSSQGEIYSGSFAGLYHRELIDSI